MTAFYGNVDPVAHEEESLRTLARALELGINFLDTAWIYQVRYLIFFLSDCDNFSDSPLVEGVVVTIATKNLLERL